MSMRSGFVRNSQKFIWTNELFGGTKVEKLKVSPVSLRRIG